MRALFKPGDVVAINFPGVTGVKRRPAVVLSSEEYHSARPDITVGLITSQTSAALPSTDYALRDWGIAGLHAPSAFRSFLVTLPPTSQPVLVGRLTERDWKEVVKCLRRALAVAERR
jgi:mRNA interferase MazF